MTPKRTAIACPRSRVFFWPTIGGCKGGTRVDRALCRLLVDRAADLPNVSDCDIKNAIRFNSADERRMGCAPAFSKSSLNIFVSKMHLHPHSMTRKSTIMKRTAFHKSPPRSMKKQITWIFRDESRWLSKKAPNAGEWRCSGKRG
jgi:hypothetical protein